MPQLNLSLSVAARRRAAAKKKKLKNLGKSKSTDTEEEEGEDDQDDGELYFAYPRYIHSLLVHLFTSLYIQVDDSSSQSVRTNPFWNQDKVQVARDFTIFSSQNLRYVKPTIS